MLESQNVNKLAMFTNYNSDKIVNNVEILAQSLADFALIYNFQDTHILGASRGHLSDSPVFLYYNYHTGLQTVSS